MLDRYETMVITDCLIQYLSLYRFTSTGTLLALPGRLFNTPCIKFSLLGLDGGVG